MKKLFVVFIIAVFAITACSKKETAGSAGGEKTPITMSVYYPLHPSDKAEHFNDEAPGIARLREKTGVSIKWTLIPGASTQMQMESFNLLMASGDLPDVIVGTVPTQLKLYPDAWLPLDELIKGNPGRYPNLNQYIYGDEYLMKYLPDADGKIRYIPMLATRRIGSSFMVRQDLLDKYGLKMPTTVDEWYTALKAAKADGKIPYMTRGQRGGIMNGIFEGFMDCVLEDYFVEDGKVKYGALDPRYKEAIEIARKWYAEGLIDPEYPSTGSTPWWEATLRGDIFATSDNVQRLAAANLEFMNQKSSNLFAGTGPMKSPRTGLRNTVGHYPKVRDKSAAISRNAKNPERILDYYEYCFSEEGFILMNFGIEGMSFEYVDGTPRVDPDYTKAVNEGLKPHVITTKDMPKNQKDELYFDYNMDRPDHNSLRAVRDEYVKGEYIRENWIASLSFTDAERAELASPKAELDTYRGEWLDKFIMGIEPMSKWDSFTAQLQKMNLQKTIDIYQAALDRLLK